MVVASTYGATVGPQNTWSFVLIILIAVVSVLCLGTSKDPNIMVHLRSLSLSAACRSFAFTSSHRAGRDNCIADALSHFDFVFIISHHMQHQRHPNLTFTAGQASCNLTDKCATST